VAGERREKGGQTLRRQYVAWPGNAVNSSRIVGEIALLVGAVLILLAAVGVLRFRDALTRMHALSKASTLGVSIALVGAAVASSRVNDITSLLFATVLQAATNPVASTLLMQATYYAEGIANRVDTVDELAQAVRE
jgi:multicomponent Na+:H+ antiporter subunit G